MFSGRCFAFGCSFTNWFYPTWADIIGINYNSFYNFAKGGTSNFTHFQRFIEVDQIYKFEKNDTILWGLTNLSRHNFLLEDQNRETLFFGCGALNKEDHWFDTHEKYKDHSHIIKFARDHYWKEKWGIYYTWLAVSNVKRLCEALGCKLVIIPGMNINVWENDGGVITNDAEQNMLREITKNLTIKISLQDYDENNYKKPYPIKDQHPFMDANWGYINSFLPEFVTPKSRDYYNSTWSSLIKKVTSKECTNENEVWNHLIPFKKQINDWKEDQKLYGRYV